MNYKEKIIFSFGSTGDFENDNYSVRIRLSYLIPEFLPIRGKRARIYYHGIAPFCVTCYNPGHTKNDCHSEQVSWADYILSLKDTGIPLALFEPLDTSLNQTNTSNPSFSTPRQDSEITRERLLSLLQNLAREQIPNLNLSLGPQGQAGPSGPANQEQNPNPPPPVQINPIPRIVTRSRSAAENSPQDQIPARGRGRGRGARGNFNLNPVGRGQQNPFAQPLHEPLNPNLIEVPYSGEYFDWANSGRGRGANIRGRLRAQTQSHAFGNHLNPYLGQGHGQQRRG